MIERFPDTFNSLNNPNPTPKNGNLKTLDRDLQFSNQNNLSKHKEKTALCQRQP